MALIILLFLLCNYRLEWEWATEYAVSAQVRITADILCEETADENVAISTELLDWIKLEQSDYGARDMWLARYYDVFTMGLRKISHRQLN